MSLLGVLRTERAHGPGGHVHSLTPTWKSRRERNKTLPLTRAGVVTADMYWERITYFLERVVPVANEYKVRLACHPNDSIVPDGGYQGIDPVLSRPEGLKRFVTIQDSPYHGLNLCLGVLSQMHMKPDGGDLGTAYLAGVAEEDLQHPLPQHQRRIASIRRGRAGRGRGGLHARGARARRRTDMTGTSRPTTTCAAKGDTTGGQAYTAFVYGYIAASIKAAETTVEQLAESQDFGGRDVMWSRPPAPLRQQATEIRLPQA